MKEKKEILSLLEKNIITVDEAIDMLNKLTEPSEDIKKVLLSYEEAIESIVDNVINDMDVDAVVKIMQDMKWEYYFSGHVVTKEEVIECMKDNVRYALNYLVKNKIKHDNAQGSTGTGGFWCDAWVDDGDEDNIQIDLRFQPYSAYGDGHLDKLVKLKLEEENNKD